jgi:hypothetical protein
MIFTRPLMIAYAALTAATALMVAAPKLAILASILTIGLGGLIPSIWLYASAMMPGLLLRRIGVHRSLAALVSISAAAALAIIPARIAAPHARQMVLELTADDFRNPLPHRPKRIELVREQVAFVKEGDDPIEHAACDEICQHLLLTRQVTAVTVTAHALVGKPPIVVTYSLAAMARCPVVFDSQNSKILPSATRARIAGLCITPARGIGMTDGIRIRDQELTSRSVPTFSLISVKLARRVEVWERQHGADIPLLRSTETEIGTVSTPFTILPYGGLLTTVSGIGIAKDYRAVKTLPLLALMDQLGFSLVPDGKRRDNMTVQAMITRADERLRADRTTVTSILARPGADRFDPDLQNAVMQWTEPFWLGKVKPDDEDLSILTAVTLDRRISRIGGLNVLWRGSPDMVALLAEPILKRLAWPVSKPSYDQDRQLAYLVRGQDKAFLTAHSTALLAIVRDRLSRNTSPLLFAVVGLGRDALPVVLAGLDSADLTIRLDAIDAACRASADATTILPAIRTMLAARGRDNARLIVALAALSGIDAAKQEIERQPPQDQKTLWAVLRHHTVAGKVRCPGFTG